MTLALLGLAAHAADPAPVAAAAPTAHVFSEQALAVHKLLSARDQGPTCQTIEAAAGEAPVTVLLEIVDHATMPPWAGIRAAECLIAGHAAEIEPQLLQWVTLPEKKGLAILTASSIDSLPAELGVKVAETAVAGPLAATTRTRLARSKNPSIQAIAAR